MKRFILLMKSDISECSDVVLVSRGYHGKKMVEGYFDRTSLGFNVQSNKFRF